MYDELVSLLEANLSDVLRKQASITRAFPEFFDRVKAVGRMGGINMKKEEPGLWYFKIHSGTKADTWYDFVLRFKNIETVLRFAINNLHNWLPDKSRANRSTLAREVLYHCDLAFTCSCPADLYWSHHFTRSRPKYGAKYTEPENRAPTRNNKKQMGFCCKHCQLMLDLLPMYLGTLSKHLNRFYSKEIEAQEAKVRRQRDPVREVPLADRGEPGEVGGSSPRSSRGVQKKPGGRVSPREKNSS